MGTVTTSSSFFLPLHMFDDHQSFSVPRCRSLRYKLKKNRYKSPVVMRLFGPAIFEASKLKVLFLGVDKQKHPGKLPRTYTLTHSDITSKLTLAISQTINNSQLQGWYNKLQRDEVVAEWKKVKGKMSLHVHCHISGGHFLLDLFSKLRYYIFCKELPVVLKAFVHGDEDLFNNYPELQEALVWVYFHSNLPEFDKVECWGPLMEAVNRKYKINFSLNLNGANNSDQDEQLPSVTSNSLSEMPEPCKEACTCCFPPNSLIPWTHSLLQQDELTAPTDSGISGTHQGLNQQQS